MSHLTVALLCLHLVMSPPADLRSQEPWLLAGVLELDSQGQCLALRVRNPSFLCLLDDYGSFAAGDTVTVVGSLDTELPCGDGYFGHIVGNRIGPWRGFDFGCGTLMIDSEYGCQVMLSPVFGPISVDGWTGFHDGDVIRLRGTLFLQTCMAIPECAGAYCISSPLADPCPSPDQSVTWGQIKARYRRPPVGTRLTRP